MINNYPQTSMQDMNLDWIIAKVKELAQDWAIKNENWDKWQTDTNTAFADLKSYVMNYFDNLDVQDEINTKLDEMYNDGKLNELMNLYVPYVTPEMFGAKGDGTTDDTTAFIECLNTKKLILLANKTYLINSLTISNTNFNIKGTQSIIKVNGQINLSYVSKSFISNVTFNGNDTNTCFYGGVSGLILNNCIFNHFESVVKARQDSAWNGNISMTDCVINDCNVFYEPLNTSPNSNSFIRCDFNRINKIFYSNLSNNVYWENISLINCDIENNGILFSNEISTNIFSPLDIIDCYIENTVLFNGDVAALCNITGTWIYSSKVILNNNSSKSVLNIKINQSILNNALGSPFIILGENSNISLIINGSSNTFRTPTGITDYKNTINASKNDKFIYHNDANNNEVGLSKHKGYMLMNEYYDIYSGQSITIELTQYALYLVVIDNIYHSYGVCGVYLIGSAKATTILNNANISINVSNNVATITDNHDSSSYTVSIIKLYS